MSDIERALDGIPDELQKLLKEISQKCHDLDFKAYIVGGAVRDMLLGVKFTDVDITVVGDALRLAEALKDSYGYRSEEHPFFKTVTLDTGGQYSIDIATARRETYSNPAALPEIYPSGLYDDLSRRDFTINTMAVAMDNFRFVDYFGGYSDLCNGLIRVLHDISFVDDPTRILRGIRLEIRYGFRMDDKTEKLMKESIKAKYPMALSSERILTEMELILSEPRSISMLGRVEETGLWKMLSGKSFISPLTYRKLEGIKTSRKNRLLFAALALLEDIRDEGLLFGRYRACFKELEAYRTRENSLGLPVQERMLENGLLYRLFTGTEDKVLEYLYVTAVSEQFRKNLRRYSQEVKDFKFYFDGRTLESFGIEPGPRYKDLLERARFKMVERSATDRQAQLWLLKEMLQKGE